MYFVDNQNEHDPCVNLALEEYLLKQSDNKEDLLLFYINEPSIIIGRHQNTLEEINKEYVEQHGIQVVRRLSGGGAVYHDLGNLNFSFITNFQPGYFKNFQLFTEPVIRCLHNLGVNAELSGRNDIQVKDRKVSGNAQYISHGRIVSHGTLLFNTELSHVSEALHVHENKIVSKSVKSVRSRVANIQGYLRLPMTIESFREALLNTYFENSARIQRFPLSEQDWENIRSLANERYRTWDWTYGNSPVFNIEKRKRFPDGEIDARMDVKKGIIQSVKFFGDYFAERGTEDLENLLIGVRYERKEIERTLQNVRIEDYFSGLDLHTFVIFLY